jgi:hypothetical protein
MLFWTNGTKQATLSADGNLGLGVTPSAWSASYKALQMSGGGMALMSASGSGFQFSNAYFDGSFKYYANGAASMYANGGGAHAWYIAASGTAGNAISFTQAMTLDASGRLGLGNTSPDVMLRITGANVANKGQLMIDSTTFSQMSLYNGSTRYAQIYADVSGSNTGMYIGTATAQPLLFATNDTERARIDSSGNLLVGTTTAYAKFVAYQDAATHVGAFQVSTAGYGIRFLNPSATDVGSIIINSTTTAFNTSSDYRLKEDIQPMTGALAKVAALKPCTYKWKADGSDGEGFIAHELQAVVPQCVTGEKDAVDADGKPVYQGIDTSFLIATLTAAIQEQQSIIESLKARLDAANL